MVSPDTSGEIDTYDSNRGDTTDWQGKIYKTRRPGIEIMALRVHYRIRLEQQINTAVDELERGVNDETNTGQVKLRTLMYTVIAIRIGS